MRRPAARKAVSQVGAVACSHCSGWFRSAGWTLSAGTHCRRVVPRRVTLVLVSCVRACPHSMAGIQTCLPWACSRARQRTRSTMASWRPLPWLARSWRALTVSRVQLSCRRYQPRGVLKALPGRASRRRLVSRMVVGVRGGRSGSGGGWQDGLSRSCSSTSMYRWSWAGLVGPGGGGWSCG